MIRPFATLGRASILALAFGVASPQPLWAGGDPAGQCAAARIKAAGKACSTALKCHSKYAKAPGKDPGQVKLGQCLTKNGDKLTAVMAKIRAKAGGVECSVSEFTAQSQAEVLSEGTRVGMLTDWDPMAGDAVDDAYRSALLKAGSKVCGQTLGVIAKDVAKPNEAARESGLEKALVGFVKASAKAAAKAGGTLDIDLLQAIVDDLVETPERLAPPADADDAVPVEVTSGDGHSCLLRDDWSVSCWGDDASGQATVPNEGFFSVAAGGAHTCGIRESDDQAQCWGADGAGQVSGAPDDELGFFIAAGFAHSCALRFDNTAVCWGDDTYGQSTPPDPSREYFGISAGDFHTCATRLADGKVDCWGRNEWGQLNNPFPDALFSTVSAGGELSCGVASGSQLSCWGNTQIPPAGIFFDVSAGKTHACAISADDFTATCWGSFGPWRAPPDNETFVDIAAGGRHTCALTDDFEGQVTCWGDDDLGQTSCSGVADCLGEAPKPCSIATEGPVVGRAGRITITEVLGDPENDYRLIMPESYFEALVEMAPGSGILADVVTAFNGPRRVACDGDDRRAIDFPGDAVSVGRMLEELGVLEVLFDAFITTVLDPVRAWIKEKVNALAVDYVRSEFGILWGCAFQLLLEDKCVIVIP